jgi:hypothetical protein
MGKRRGPGGRFLQGLVVYDAAKTINNANKIFIIKVSSSQIDRIEKPIGPTMAEISLSRNIELEINVPQFWWAPRFKDNHSSRVLGMTREAR